MCVYMCVCVFACQRTWRGAAQRAPVLGQVQRRPWRGRRVLVAPRHAAAPCAAQPAPDSAHCISYLGLSYAA